jgi:acid phosphatase (class A)
MKFKLIPFLSVFLFHITPEALAKPYFSATSISPEAIEEPLEVNSDEWKREIGFIKDWQKHADKNEVEEAREEIHMKAEMVALKVDPDLTEARFPKLYKLLNRVDDTSREITKNVKDFWHTKRPYQLDAEIRPLVESPQNPSYPSGHTTGAYVWADVLALVMPEKKEKFMARAEEIAQHRIMVGVHYPHDIKGGKELAAIIFKKLQENPQFKRDVEAAIKEQR